MKHGVDITTVASRLGHTNVRTTYQYYVKVTSKMKNDAVNKFEEFADGLPVLQTNPNKRTRQIA